LWAVLGVAGRAATGRSWTASLPAEFARGSLEGVAVDEEGQVVLAPAVETLWGPEGGIVWDLAPDGSDGVFAGLSSPGQVLHVAPGREPRVWYSGGPETLIAAILPDGPDAVLAGGSPAGTVLRVRRGGDVEDYGTTGSAFVWDLARGFDGEVYAATGQPGRLLVRRSDGAWQTLLETGEDPVRCLAVAPGGGVVLGTGANGRVVRVDADGRAFGLLDVEETEIVGLDVRPDGTIWALAARGAKQGVGAAKRGEADAVVRVVATPAAAEGAEGADEEDAEAPPAPRAGAPSRLKAAGGGALYRISPDGGARKLWDSATDVPFALAPAEGGRHLVATGDEGRVHLVGEDGRSSLWIELPSDQASALAAAGGGRVLVAGTADARIARVASARRSEGSYVSPVIDAGTAAEWGRLRWVAEVPPGAGLSAALRVGNTQEPDATWSDWGALDGAGAARAGAAPVARWAQVRIQLRAAGGGRSPALRGLELFYTPRNRPPAIAELAVESAGVVWTRPPQQSSRTVVPAVADDPVARRLAAALAGPGAQAPVRKAYEYGARTIRWKAVDPDGDALTYRLELRAEGTTRWVPLAADIREEFFSWDARGTPDGDYRVRLTALDAQDNAPGSGAVDQRVGPLFSVDHTRPSFDGPRLQRGSAGSLAVEFAVRDPSGVAAVEVAIDAGEWGPLEPEDGVADSEEERYRLALDAPVEGGAETRILRVRATDAAGNQSGQAWPLGPERPAR